MSKFFSRLEERSISIQKPAVDENKFVIQSNNGSSLSAVRKTLVSNTESRNDQSHQFGDNGQNRMNTISQLQNI